MANPTGISRAVLREAAFDIRMVSLCVDEYYRGKIDSDNAMRSAREHATNAELVILRLLTDIEKECTPQ